ncbi:EAL domain-containing protein [Reinekea sp.]|uniref:EAL domain-containing protein n=1 Tax=Reinekea sp. TaxID=1970455 RepID=UPI002A8038B4|nr:EAL domain-containing protein [Reinekea sp.]
MKTPIRNGSRPRPRDVDNFKSSPKRSLTAKKLRKRAESVAQAGVARFSESSNTMSNQDTLAMIHDLRVHQIELEMQNDSLLVSQQKLQTSEERYFKLYNLAPVGYCTLNPKGLVLQANLTTSLLLGIDGSRLRQQPLARFFYDKDKDNFYRFCHKIQEDKIIINAPLVCVMKMHDAKGNIFWANVVGAYAENNNGDVEIRLVITNVTEHQNDIEEIRRLAFFDHLTGLPNRRLLVDRLEHALITTERTGLFAALMFLDLDHFKTLNDTLGHAMGDLLLKAVSDRLQSSLREGDSLARLGGDEFVVLLENLSGCARLAAKQTEMVANKILGQLNEEYHLNNTTYHITASLGIVMFTKGHLSIEDLLKNTDVAMYQAKAAGRNTARFFDPAMQAAVEQRTRLEKDLRHGLSKNQFILYYQIQTNIEAEVVGAEALIRWLHPQRGLILPASFIPLAEETHVILGLGQWVLEAACAQLATWSKHPKMKHWSLSVNVSALQFSQESFVDSVVNALQHSAAKPELLKLELTESMLVTDVVGLIKKMRAIKSLGVSFSLDDFGTGYSSLSYLKRLPLDQLKIDQSFVREVTSDENDAVICQTIVALGHSLGLNVIAEGVENVEQYQFLMAVGCDQFQGNYFSRPVTSGLLPAPKLMTKLQ